MPHLVATVSGHGFGHAAQTAPILNLLHRLRPELQITVRSSVPLAHLGARIQAPFTYLPDDSDIGMLMSSALDVRVAESCRAYREFHAGWDARIAAEAALLRELKADLVFSNIAYLPLAGAQRAGIPNAALCSLNWADIHRHFCNDAAISRQIYDAYKNADAFFRATPGMAMDDLHNLIPVAPIAYAGATRRDELHQRLNLPPREKLVLVSMGGITSRIPIEGWPRTQGVRWLVQQNWQVEHPDAVAFESLGMDFSDLLASCDALLCKPGYGSFVEAACSGVPVLYVSRADWPESAALIEWLQRHGVCREVSRDMLEQGKISGALNEIWSQPRPKPINPQGAMQVAEWLANKLDAATPKLKR